MAYITVEDMIVEGVPDTAGIEVLLLDRIALAVSTFELLTSRFFERRTGLTLDLSGRGHDTLWLPVPPVTKTSITAVIADDVAVDAADYRVVMPTWPDGRFNPKLIKVAGIWPKGDANIQVTGDFGFVDAAVDALGVTTFSAPLAVKRAVARIAMLELPKLGDGDAQRNRMIVQESLKDYSYRLREAQGAGAGFFDDPLIDNAIAAYKQRMITTP